MNGLKQLRELAFADSRRRHPDFPETARFVKPYSDKTANQLTQAIIDFIRFNGFQAERINCTGKPIDQTKVITDILGDMRRVGSVKWLPTSGQKGTADISAVIRGRAIKIEVKMKDKQSEAQKEYEQQVIRAGGVYYVARDFESFKSWFDTL